MATIKSTADLLTQAGTDLPDNTTQLISPQDIREMSENNAISSFNKITDNSKVGLKAYDSALSYELEQGVVFGGLAYIANTTTTPGAFAPAEWDTIAGATVTAGVGIIKTGSELRLGNHYLGLASTGLYTGAVLSIGATVGTFDLTTGEGFYIDSNTDFNLVKDNVQPVIVSARTNEVVTNILTQPVTYILIDKDDNIVQNTTFPTPQERRDNIFLGVVVHSDNVIVNVVNNLQVTANDVVAQVGDVMEGLGFFSLKGNVTQANGANLSINKTTGTAFKRGGNYVNNKKDPHTVSLPLQTLATFRYRNQDSSEGSNITVLDPTTYDLAGVTTTVPANNNATIQRVYVFPTGIIRIQRGQEVFSNFSDAVDGVGKESFLTETNIEENGLLLASIVMKKNATSLQDSAESQIFIASRFGELGSVGSSVTTNLQQAYNNSTEPEIITTVANGAISVQRGSAADTDTIYEGKNGAGAVTFSVDGNGLLQGDGSALTGISADNMATANLLFPAPRTHDLAGFGLTFSDGQTTLIGTGTTDATSALLVKNATPTTLLDIKDDGKILYGKVGTELTGTGWAHHFVKTRSAATSSSSEFVFEESTGSALQLLSNAGSTNSFVFQDGASRHFIEGSAGTMRFYHGGYWMLSKINSHTVYGKNSANSASIFKEASNVHIFTGGDVQLWAEDETVNGNVNNPRNLNFRTAYKTAGGSANSNNMRLTSTTDNVGNYGLIIQEEANVELFKVMNNGDIFTETLQGLNVTLDPTAITSMTFTNGILTAQS